VFLFRQENVGLPGQRTVTSVQSRISSAGGGVDGGRVTCSDIIMAHFQQEEVSADAALAEEMSLRAVNSTTAS